jgi:tetratricopeptide (TPR) repeat protein
MASTERPEATGDWGDLEQRLRDLFPEEAADPRHRARLEEQILQARTDYVARRAGTKAKLATPRLSRGLRRLRRVPIAAAVILAVGLTLTLLPGRGALDGAKPAWALEQSIAALQDVRTVFMRGVQPDGASFECWIKPKAGCDELDRLRFESPEVVAVVRGDTVQAYFPRTDAAEILSGMVDDAIRAWHVALQLRPWVGDGLLRQLQAVASDWRESYGRDEQGRNCAFVQCGFPPLGISFWFAFDVDSKRVVRARQWQNLIREGPPAFEVNEVVYNQDIPDARFELQPPAGARVFDGRTKTEQQELLDQAEALYRQQKYHAAIDVYLQIHEQYPNWNYAAHALMMVGISYDRLGDHDQELQYLEQAAREYPDLRGWSEATWFYLGQAYASRRDWEPALPAFEKCVELCQGVRDPRGFPCKNAREGIAWVHQQTELEKAEALRHEERFTEAIEAYLQVHQRYPNTCSASYALMMVGMCYRKLDNREQTLQYLQQAAQECPDSCRWEPATMHYFIGDEYAARGDQQRARAEFQKCVDLCPDAGAVEEFPWKEAREAIDNVERQGRELDASTATPSAAP